MTDAPYHRTTWLDAWRNGMPLWRALRFHARLTWRRNAMTAREVQP